MRIRKENMGLIAGAGSYIAGKTNIPISEARMMKSKENIISVITWVVPAALVVLFGCFQGEIPSMPAISAQVSDVKSLNEDTKGPTQNLAFFKGDTWNYNPTGKRNPFQILDPPQVPVEYNLDNMLLDGVVLGPERVAHIRLPDKREIYVKEGDKLGLNNGKVRRITPDQVVVEEIYVNPANPSEIYVIEKIIKIREGKKKGN